MDLRGKRIILGSNSPRRRELLKGLDIDFEIDTCNNFNECFSPDTPYSEVPVLMSEGKSAGFHRSLSDGEILITADTMVILSDEILGKPHTREEAVKMLRDLSGKEHRVITAVTLRDSSRMKTESDTTRVWFKDLSDEEIFYYLDKYRPYDKAGAYGVQEWIGYTGISRIDGSYFNVVGFPVHLVYRMLQEFIG
ncbi:MAG: septum formation protein Maf [Bacteroidales bacterium]|nr:septum formation protein Maf [Bacteroidales bacterium]